MAWVLSLNGQAHRSEAAARQAIACDPGHGNAYNNLGLALMRQSRLDEAEAVLRRAVALRPGFRPAALQRPSGRTGWAGPVRGT